MSWIECGSCEEMVDVCGNTVRLPYICGRCEKDAALAEEVRGLYIEEEDDLPFDPPYNSGMPCQSALDDRMPVGEAFLTLNQRRYQHDSDVLDSFDADTELIDGLIAETEELRMQLDQANKNVQVQGEIIADLENTLGAYRVIFRIPGY